MYASDKSYDQGVYEADRAYDQGVYEADKQYASDIYKTDHDYEVGMASADNNKLSILLGILQSNNVTAEGRAELEKILGWEAGTLQASPTGGSGGGGGYSGGGRSGGSGGSYSSGSRSSGSGGGSTVSTYNNALVAGDKDAWVNAYIADAKASGFYVPIPDAEAIYENAYTEMFDATQNMSRDDFIERATSRYGVTPEQAGNAWARHNKQYTTPKFDVKWDNGSPKFVPHNSNNTSTSGSSSSSSTSWLGPYSGLLK